MTPRAGSALTHGGHRAAASAGPKLNAKRRHAVANKFFQSTVQLVMSVCVCAGKAEKKRSTGRHINTARGTAGWQRCMRYGPTSTITHGGSKHPSKKIKRRKQRKNTAAGCGCVCGAAGVCPPWPQGKQNKRERNVCSAPQALVARPHVTAPSARRSSRPLLMRAAGEAHRAVVMSVSVGVRVEQLGGNTRHPSQEEC
ncbi:hypothetical protein TcCL_Unassigned04388, partial [Trypanosoma cruzi]